MKRVTTLASYCGNASVLQKKTNRETVKERNIDANLLRVKKSRITACEKEMKSIIDEIFG